jgi:hypothetical protein
VFRINTASNGKASEANILLNKMPSALQSLNFQFSILDSEPYLYCHCLHLNRMFSSSNILTNNKYNYHQIIYPFPLTQQTNFDTFLQHQTFPDLPEDELLAVFTH